MFSLPLTSARQREIVEIVLGNGWDYMRRLLTVGKADEPKLPPPEVFRKILSDLGPFYIKLGQILSTRPDLLPPNYIRALSSLQANVPPVAWTDIEATLIEQFERPLNEIFAEINPQPIAAGSIGQIHKATLLDGQAVAIKIKRPGIDRIVAQDIQLIKSLAELVSLTEFGQTYDIVNLANEFAQAITLELNFTQEAQFTDKISSNLAKSPWLEPNKLVIPKIYWQITTEKVLVLEWLAGKPLLEADFSKFSTQTSIERRKAEVTSLLFRAFFQQLYIDGFFHADPHPGNIFYLDNDQIALIDCGMVGRLDPRTQQILTQMLLAIVDLDAQSCGQLTLDLAESAQPINLEELRVDYEKILRKYYDLSLENFNFSEVVYEILQVARKNKIKVPGNLGLYAKCLANLEGSARQFNPNLNVLDEVKPLMSDLFRQQLIGDTPLQTSLRTVLDLKSIALKAPRQVESLLNRLSSETLQWNLRLKELDSLRRSLDESANRLSFSIVVGSLIVGAAILTTGAQTGQVVLITDILFSAASLLGLWLIISILRSGKLK